MTKFKLTLSDQIRHMAGTDRRDAVMTFLCRPEARKLSVLSVDDQQVIGYCLASRYPIFAGNDIQPDGPDRLILSPYFEPGDFD